MSDGVRPVVRAGREVRARAGLVSQRAGQGPMVVFLPSGPKTGASLLRIYNISAALSLQGWRTAALPATLTFKQRQRYLRAAAPDVVVMQGARHALNRPDLYPGWPLVYDMDDADFHLDHLATPVRQSMPQVAAVIAGSRYIADWALEQGAPAAHVVWTGTPVTTSPRRAHVDRRPVVAWAQTRPMTYRHEAAVVAQVMAKVANACPGVTLRLYDRRPDDDAAFKDRFAAPGLSVDWYPSCSYGAYLASFDDVAIGLAPLCPDAPFSRGKSFGKVLGYLDRGVAVVGSDAGEHGAFFAAETGVITNDETLWVAEILRLLRAPDARQQMACAARADFKQALSVDAAAAGVAAVLNTIVKRPVRKAATNNERAA